MDGSILLFDGQATVFKPGHGCYRCLYPAPPPPGLVPSCAAQRMTAENALGNEAMRGINRSLGFVPVADFVELRGPTLS